MGKTLDIIDRQISVGQVKTIRTGEYLDYVELLFSPTTKVQLAPSADNKSVRLSVSDNSLELPQLDCIVNKNTLYNYILSLKNLYNQLEDEGGKQNMKLKVNKGIENNIITVDISVMELGTSTATEIEEAKVLTDFPRSIKFSDISFKANMRIDDTTGDPVVTSDPVDSTNVEEVQIENLINKEYAINQDMNIVMTFDVTKIPSSALNNVFDTVEKLGKAYAELFSVKVKEEIGKKLTELRSLNTKFEGETEVVL